MKNKPLKKISGYINQYNINEQYNDNVDFEDIRPLLKEKKNIKRTVGLINHAIELTKTIKENEIHNINLNNNACSINNFNKSYWLFDSGAGEHLTNNINLLKNFKEEKITLRCANNTICTFDGYGEFTFKINSYKINLKRVLYSKDVVKNIISGNELIKLGIIAITEPTNNDMVKLTLKDLGGNVIGTFHSNEYNEIIIAANHNNEMEYSTNKNIFTTKKINEESRIIWHRRLGHYYLDDLPKFLELHNIKEPLCEDCKISKMKRSPHNKITPKAEDILDVILLDIIGPIRESLTNKKFILTVLDEKSHKSWIFLMKSKAETIEILINFLKYLNNIFN